MKRLILPTASDGQSENASGLDLNLADPAGFPIGEVALWWPFDPSMPGL
jgi:hypothetical protein